MQRCCAQVLYAVRLAFTAAFVKLHAHKELRHDYQVCARLALVHEVAHRGGQARAHSNLTSNGAPVVPLISSHREGHQELLGFDVGGEHVTLDCLRDLAACYVRDMDFILRRELLFSDCDLLATLRGEGVGGLERRAPGMGTSSTVQQMYDVGAVAAEQQKLHG